MNNQRGASFVEVVVVAAILTLILAVTIPLYWLDRAQKRQAFCEENLLKIASLEQEAFLKNGRYAASLEELGWQAQGVYRYSLKLSEAGSTGSTSSLQAGSPQGGFEAACEGNLDFDKTLDRMEINEGGVINKVVDDLAL